METGSGDPEWKLSLEIFSMSIFIESSQPIEFVFVLLVSLFTYYKPPPYSLETNDDIEPESQADVRIPFTNLELNIMCVMKKHFTEFNKNGCVVANSA